MSETKRQKLSIKEVSEIKFFGDKGQKLPFTSTDGVKWLAYRKSLFQYIIAGAEIDADTETKERKVGDAVYTDHVVQEIYIDAKPVSQQAKQGFQPRGSSPEERASIESQVAAKCTTELWIAGKLVDDAREVTALRDWLLSRLGGHAKKVEIPKASEAKLIEKAKEIVSQANRDPETIKNYIELCRACNKDFGMQPEDVKKELNITGHNEIAETMPNCYRRILAVMRPKEQ